MIKIKLEFSKLSACEMSIHIGKSVVFKKIRMEKE